MGHLWDLIHVKIYAKVNLVALKYAYYDEIDAPLPKEKVWLLG